MNGCECKVETHQPVSTQLEIQMTECAELAARLAEETEIRLIPVSFPGTEPDCTSAPVEIWPPLYDTYRSKLDIIRESLRRISTALTRAEL